jgi:hypothetical protein
MRDFEDSTLWRVSEFERVRVATGTSGFARLEGSTVLSSTLLADLRSLDEGLAIGDALEVAAACMRHREAALLYLKHEELLWPVTLFPQQALYHSPRDMTLASAAGMAQLEVIGCEPPGVRPPGHWMQERVAQTEHYRPLTPLLWSLALHGPRKELLSEIAGQAVYRVTTHQNERPAAPGAMGSAAERLRRGSASLKEIANWPGLSVERASRLLNALYLASSLMVVRSHPSTRSQSGLARSLIELAWSRRR